MAIVQEKPTLLGAKTCRAFLIDSSFVQNSSIDTVDNFISFDYTNL